MFRKVDLPDGIEGQLHLHRMPGRVENWSDFEAELLSRNIDSIACLAPFEEIEVKSPTYAQILKEGKLTVGWSGFPVPDYGVPVYISAYLGYVRSISQMIFDGEKLLLHCAGGIGRTGMTGILLLRYLGLSSEEAVESIQNAGSRPDTQEQWDLCKSHFAESSD